MKYNGIHSDFLKYKNLKIPMNPVILPAINFFMTKMFYMTPVGNGLKEAKFMIKGYKGESIRLTVISSNNCDEVLPALVYFHGGAFATQAATFLKRLIAEYALRTPCKVVFVDYRLLPKAKFPTGLEDCYCAYKWAIENTETLGIDSDRIAVGGDSAGGTLSIGVCLLAEERKLKKPCFQMLIYPVTDVKQATASMKEFTNTPLWDSRYNAKMWSMYLRDVPSEKKKNASPAQAPSLKGIPPTYIEVSEYDCLRDEGIEFANKLQENGINTLLYQTKKTVHGFEIAEDNEIVRESVERRIKVLQKALRK